MDNIGINIINVLVALIKCFSCMTQIITIIISVLAIFIPHRLEVRRKKKEEENLITTENDFFEESLKILESELSIQICSLKNYLKNKQYHKLKINPTLQIDFLKSVNLKSIYKRNTGEEKRKQINNLIAGLYSLYSFNNYLIRSFDSFLKEYRTFESAFLDNYKKVFYKKPIEIIKKHSRTLESYQPTAIQNEFFKKYYDIASNFKKMFVAMIRRLIEEK